MKQSGTKKASIKMRILKMSCGFIAVLAAAGIAAGSISSYQGLMTNANSDLNSISNIANAATSKTMSDLLNTAEQAAVTYRSNTELGKHNLERFCQSNSDIINGAALITTVGNIKFSTSSTLKNIKFGNDKYMQQANTTGKPVFGTTISVGSGKVIVPIYLPVCNSNDIVVLEAPGSFFSSIVKNFKIAKTGSVFIADRDGTIIGSANASLVNARTNYINAAKTDSSKKQAASVFKDMAAGKTGNMNYDLNGSSNICYYMPITSGNGFSISAAAPVSEMTSSIWVTILSIIISMALLAFVCAALVVKFAEKLTKPIIDCANRLTKLADGDLTSAVPKTTATDETGVLLGKLEKTVSFMREVVSEISNYLASIARGDLTKDDPPAYKGDFAEVSKSIKTINDSLNHVVDEIVQSSTEVTSGSEQIAAGAQALSQGSTEQASSVEELAATVQDISSQAQGNSKNAAEAEKKAAVTSEKLALGKAEMQKMLESINDIHDSSSQIGKIIKSIEDIAFQTNILALNAAVEAARAGEAGKGFAVVADEVRNLANKSSDASKETTKLIEHSVNSVNSGIENAKNTASIMDEIAAAADLSTELVRKISDASQQQNTAIQQVTLGMDQISSVVQTNSATAEESAAASEELSGQAAMLKKLVSYFHTKANSSYLEDSNYSE